MKNIKKVTVFYDAYGRNEHVSASFMSRLEAKKNWDLCEEFERHYAGMGIALVDGKPVKVHTLKINQPNGVEFYFAYPEASAF